MLIKLYRILYTSVLIHCSVLMPSTEQLNHNNSTHIGYQISTPTRNNTRMSSAKEKAAALQHGSLLQAYRQKSQKMLDTSPQQYKIISTEPAPNLPLSKKFSHCRGKLVVVHHLFFITAFDTVLI